MIFFVLLSLLGYCLTLTRFSKWPIEYTPFFVVSSVVTLLYVFAYWGFLKIGANSIIILGNVLFLFSLIFLRQQKDILWKKYLTPGFIISAGFTGLFLLFASQGHFHQWDEFSQWGPHSKLVFYHNGFVTQSDVTVLKSYPLGGALFHYLFYRAAGYSESHAYIAQCLLMMAPLFIVIHQYEWRHWQKAFIAFSAVLLLFLLLHVEIGPTQTLYMDDAVGIYFGMSMVAYFASRKNASAILYLIPIIATFSLLKTKLYPLMVMILFVILVDQLILDRKNIFSKIVALLTLPLAAYVIATSWHHYLNKIGEPLARQLHLTFSTVKNTLFAPAGSLSHTIIINYAHHLIPAIGFVIIIFVLNTITFLIHQNKPQKMAALISCATLFLGFIAYIFGLLIMYLFAFVPYEAIHTASMGRYLDIYCVAWSLVTLYFLFDAIRYCQKYFFENIVVIAIITGLLFFLFHHHKNNTWQLRQPIIQMADAVKKITKPQDKIFVVWQNSNGLEFAMLVYELTPRKLNRGCSSFGKPYDRSDVWTCDITPKKLQQQMRGSDYVLLGYTDKNFWSHYQSVLPDHHTLVPIATYTICRGDYFSSFGGADCKMEQHHAYLFKITK